MKRSSYFIAILTTLFFISIYSTVKSVPGTDCKAEIMTEFGPVKGTCLDTVDVCVWAGIPYAAPPVRDLRFKPPVDPKPWKETRDAGRFGPPCCQRTSKLALNPLKVGQLIGNENCLYLNIWRPRSDAKLPVMVWIHGGSYLTGAGSLPLYQGYRLAADRNIMVITINYRLGPMGFLSQRSLSDEDPQKSSGNYGILDQIKALDWVKHNIAHFGGDPDNVTIFGESAGGGSVCTLMASPLAKGLFHRAIMESGNCDSIATMDEGLKYGDKFVKDLDCEKGHEIECLREKSSDAIFNAALWDETGGTSPFKPHIDGWMILQKPLEAFKKGDYNHVPFMAGSNRDEMNLFKYLDWKSRRMKQDEVEQRYKKEFGDEAAKRIIALYPFSSFEKPIDAYTAAVGDKRLGCEAYRAAEAMAASNNSIYIYRFDFDDIRFPKLGACHGMEIPFIFDSFDKKPVKLVFKKENIEAANPLAGSMRKYWSTFALSGNPNAEGLSNWPVYNSESRQFIVFDNKIGTDSFKPDGRCEFWNQYLDKKP